KSLSGFGCRLLAYDVRENDEARQYAQYLPLDELLAQCDVITLHTNATAENHHLIDAAALDKCRNGVVLVNTARGSLIDSDALIAALESGRVGAAALDVLEQENGLYYYNREGDVIPNAELSILRSYPNVILSPHTAFYTDDAVESMIGGCFHSVDCFRRELPNDHEIRL
ncbi:MAG: NAD(P)-dependent oxidoreductase, partial [Gemmiger sp.]